MTFRSLLWDEASVPTSRPGEPECFGDLHLDQVVAEVVRGREDYDLAPLLHQPLGDPAMIAGRQRVFSDLEDDDVAQAVSTFSERMRRMRRYQGLARRRHQAEERQRWFLDAAQVYLDAVRGLRDALATHELGSEGLQALRDHLDALIASSSFAALARDAAAVAEALDEVRYAIAIKGRRVRVRHYEGEPDYLAEIEEAFAKFRERDAKDYRAQLPPESQMNGVEERILGLVAQLFPETFGQLATFTERHADFADPGVLTFEREAQLFLGYRKHVRALRNAGLPFCYPTVTPGARTVTIEDGFDLALARKLASQGTVPVTNSLRLGPGERVAVITGPNQGGKTTFARMVGQIHHLAALGLPVPGRRVEVGLADQVLTHFEREESLDTLRGKLEDDLTRIRGILDRATADSVLVLNELFTSTTVSDAVALGHDILERIRGLGALCLYVTFLDELAEAGPETVSLVGEVSPEDPTARTFEIVRRPADGLAYAAALAQRHRLTYDHVRERLRA